MFFSRTKTTLVPPDEALDGRDTPLPIPETHEVLGHPLTPPFPEGHQIAYFAMGCFWGAEKYLWQVDGVWTTAVGYQGGYTPNPTYEEVCSGRTGHTEAVMVVYDPEVTSYETLLKVFWENHDPTQGMRQGNDVGTQYRSAIYWTTEEQAAAAKASREAYQQALHDAGYGDVTTEIRSADDVGDFYHAEPYHQQYLAPTKNPHGYCNHGFCQVGYDPTT